MVPQFTVATFGLVWLISSLGWNETAAGLVVGASQLVGALGRIAVGHVSDRVGSRVRVLRWVAVSGVATMLALGLVGALSWSAAGAAALIAAATVSVADNGLAYTSVAEAAGGAWAGRALGVQNTGQFLAASAVGPGSARSSGSWATPSHSPSSLSHPSPLSPSSPAPTSTHEALRSPAGSCPRCPQPCR